MTLPPRRIALLIGVLVVSVLVTVGAGRSAATGEAHGPRNLSASPADAVGAGESAGPIDAESGVRASDLGASLGGEELVHPLYHSTPAHSTPAPSNDAASTGRALTGELAGRIQPLDAAPVGPESLVTPDDRAEPVRLRVRALGIDAEIVPVGVTEVGDYEVPPASQVGWYRFGSAPGHAGSAVLAAHIAWNGEDGVFRHLAELPADSTIEVLFADGSTVEAISGETSRVDKDELPPSLFERSGEPRIVLITCGGAFNRTLSSYEDNVIVTAR